MAVDETFQTLIELWEDIKHFLLDLTRFIVKSLHIGFISVEERKGIVVTALYRQRGKWSQRLTHTGMGVLAALGVIMAPLISQQFPGTSVNPWQISTTPEVLSASTQDPGLDTQISTTRGTITDYKVQPGDTVSKVAQQFGVSADTIRWQNNLEGDSIKVGDTLQILPVTGVAHVVQKGDTVYSIAKQYDAESQAIVDFPFNTFANDETFELAIGQTVIVPDGVKPTGEGPVIPRVRQTTPGVSNIAFSGKFIWPTQGVITQYFSWYHTGIDIANPAEPLDVAAASGTVIHAGWDNTGYGNMIMIDHGNCVRTLYGHLSRIDVSVGQQVNQGQVIGKMGSTGHSTGSHTHFEIWQNCTRVNPLPYLPS